MDGQVYDRLRKKNTMTVYRSRSRNHYNYHYDSYTTDNDFDELSVSMVTEVEATKGSVIGYKVTSQNSDTYLSRGGCYFNGNEVGCSYIQGKLVKRN